jgi:peptide/nickel transport system substrate-binding protein
MKMRRYASIWFILAMVVTGLAGAVAAQRSPEGQLLLSVSFTIAPTYLDPSEATQVVASAYFLYALHDALIKSLPGNPMAPALAESWTESPDGLIYEFVLRRGLTFHNGDPFTAEDVHYSFGRYKGASAKLLHAKVKAVEILDAHRLRFVLHTPWPDFLTVYSALASGVGWIVPKQYLGQVGDEGFKKHPIGLGPYRFVRADPGMGLVLDAYERYWRKTPAIQRLIIKSVPDPTTRLAMLKTGELDMASLPPDEAAAIRDDPKLRLLHAKTGVTAWLEFIGEWDPTSPWHDRRVRLAANLAIDKQAISDAAGLGLDRPTGSILPRALEFGLPLEPFPYDPAHAKRLLAEAGYPLGFNAGDLTPFPPVLRVAEAVGSYLGAVGIRTQVRSLERAAFFAVWREKKLKGLMLADSAILGNAANRIEIYVLGTGLYAYGSSPDLDALFQQQAAERDRATREALLHRLQSLMHERVMHAPLLERAALHGVGPRMEEPAVGLIPLVPFPDPYEEMRLKRP